MTRFRLLLLAGLVSVVAALAAGPAGWAPDRAGPGLPGTPPGARPGAAPAPGSAAATAAATGLGVLRGWDRRRAAAWAAGSPERLGALYVPGSAAGAADLRLLGDYRSRGLRVSGMRTQVLAVRVLERAPDRWRLAVTDRLVGAVAVGTAHRLRLPRGAATSHEVVLVLDARGVWRVAGVQPGT